MRTSMCFTVILSASLAALAACDDARTDGAVAADDDVTARACWICGAGSTANTNIVGTHDVSNVKLGFGAWATNAAGELRMNYARVVHDGALRWVSRWDVTPAGELQLYYQGGGGEVRVAGAAVAGAWFQFTYDPVVGANFEGQLKVDFATCEEGRYDDELTICRYVIVTDVVPHDPKLYPETQLGSAWYHVCPNEDEGGALEGSAKYSMVLSKHAALDMGTSPPSVAVSVDQVVFGCLNGAVSKTQYYLNAFYDHKYDPHPRALAPEQLTPVMLAWMAWHEGESTTRPGMSVCFDDPIGGLFGRCELDVNRQFEAAYGPVGASCANGGGPYDRGVHRRFAAPEVNVPGWDALPDCNGGDYPMSDPAIAVVGVYAYPGVE